MARVWTHYANGNIIDRAHKKSILDTRIYQVKFSGWDVTNEAPTSLQSQCMPSVIQI